MLDIDVVVTLPFHPPGTIMVGTVEVTVKGARLVTSGPVVIETDPDGLTVVVVRLPVTRIEQAQEGPPQ